jgi:hypothetical protein
MIIARNHAKSRPAGAELPMTHATPAPAE